MFFGEDKESTIWGVYVNEYDSEPRSDGFCYHTQYSQAKDIFVSDTHMTLENDKATSNHKVVTHITLGGKRIELATMSIKKMLLDENWVFLRLEDFK